ncbi:MAG: RsmD family RNA methyltransferase [Bacteroidetes bacterium]|nr:RsmD family RNA methyltransferase [Bacteroidota bacterium]
MRIIGGNLKGIRFQPPQNIPTRPTTDFAKEGMFNMLSHSFNFENTKVLDLFGGTGSISYEFASRGCKDITTIEIFPKCAAFIKKTVLDLNLPAVHVLQMDVFQFIKNAHHKYHLIFAGPPYPLENLATLPDLIFQYQLVDGPGWFILEHNPNHDFKNHPHYYKEKNYGTTIFSIFVNHPEKKEDEVIES